MENVNGILVLNKPKGFTSHDCVAKIRRLAKTKKVGHTGTLDPEVTGVLPICIGQATRVAEYLLDYAKEYTAEIVLGKSTTTEDQTGEVLDDHPLEIAPSEENVLDALTSFKGEIKQVPPMYSAVKVGGVRLHQLARQGKVVEREARTVRIYDLELLDYLPALPYPSIKIKVRCSKGTYIRTLGVDIGKALGYPAHMSSLVRSQSGPFTLANSVTFEELEEWTEGDWQKRLYPIDAALTHLPQIVLNEELTERVKFGQSLPLEQEVEEGQLYRIYDQHDQFMALYSALHSHVIKPKKVFLS
jgi:tRNA pseudouridine55 synthase